MARLSELAGVLAFIYALSILVRKFSEQLRFYKAAQERGCKAARRYPNLDPFFGVDLFVYFRRADSQGNRSQASADLHKKYGATFEMKAFGPAEIQTAQPENIQAIAATRFNDFGVGPRRASVGAPFLGRGVFTEDGEFWRRSRALIRPTFSRNEVADLDNFGRHVDRFLALVPKDSGTFDLQPLAKRLFLDTSTEFLFGQSVESLLPETPFDTAEFMKAFDDSLLGLAIRMVAGPLKFLFIFDAKWEKAYKKVHAFVDRHVAIALERQQKSMKSGGSKNSGSREKYILLHQMAMATQDPYELRSQILNVFLPARDTTAVAFSSIMFYIARYPKIWDELRKEVCAVGSRKLTFELLKSLKIAKAIINETLRLRPPAPRITRTALRDTILPVGGGCNGDSPLFIRKGKKVVMDLYSLQRDQKIWGADAEEFKPQRWSEGRLLWEANWQYEPFLGGLRMCPAQNQVLTQLAYLLVRVAQNFKTVENRDIIWEYQEEFKVSTRSRNGVKIALIPV